MPKAAKPNTTLGRIPAVTAATPPPLPPRYSSPNGDTQMELFEVSFLVSLLRMAADGAESPASEALTYVANRLAEHHRKLDASFSAMFDARIAERDALRAELAKAQEQAATGSVKRARRIAA